MNIAREIHLYNYYEHFKCAKEMALVYPVNHPKRTAIENSLVEQLELINKMPAEAE